MLKTPQAFANRMNSEGAVNGDMPRIVRQTLIDTLGELPAVAAITYTGDAADGDLMGFGTRIVELFGTGSEMVFDNIVEAYSKKKASGTSGLER